MYQGERGLYINDPIRALVYFGRVKSVALAWILWDMLDSCPFGLFAHEVCTHPENWSDFSHWKYTTSAIVTGFIGTLPLIMAVGGSINSSEHDVFHTSVPFLLLVSTVFYMICSYCVTVLTSDYAKTSDILVSTYVGIFCEFVSVLVVLIQTNFLNSFNLPTFAREQILTRAILVALALPVGLSNIEPFLGASSLTTFYGSLHSLGRAFVLLLIGSLLGVVSELPRSLGAKHSTQVSLV